MKFLWKSAELRDYNVEHVCVVLERCDEARVLVAVSPPIPGYLYNEVEDVELMALSPRYTESTLIPLSESPLTVNVWLPKGELSEGEFRLADIGKVRAEV